MHKLAFAVVVSAALSLALVAAQALAGNNGNIFTPPNSDSAMPTYVQPNGKPGQSQRKRLPGFQQLRSLPLTKEQRQSLNQTLGDFQAQAGPLRDQIAEIQERIKTATVVHMDPNPVTTGGDNPEELRAQIQQIRKQINEKQDEASQAVYDLLTPAQKQQLDEMRNGSFVVGSSDNLNAQPAQSKTRRLPAPPGSQSLRAGQFESGWHPQQGSGSSQLNSPQTLGGQ